MANSGGQLIRILSTLGANFSSRDSENLTILHWAAVHCAKAYVVDLLINNGADVDARDDLQMTPLHHAAKTNCIESAQKLIARGASIDAIDRKGLSILISHRVNIHSKNIHGRTPLHLYLSIPTDAYDETEIVII